MSSRLLQSIPGSFHAEIAGVNAPIAGSSGKARIHAITGAAAVDMESHIAAEIAAFHNIPFAICRTVIDPADRDLPPAAMVELRDNGTPDMPAILRSVVCQPNQIPALARTAIDAWTARKALLRARRLLGAALGCPYFNAGDRAAAMGAFATAHLRCLDLKLARAQPEAAMLMARR